MYFRRSSTLIALFYVTFSAKICIIFSTVQSNHSFEQGGVTKSISLDEASFSSNRRRAREWESLPPSKIMQFLRIAGDDVPKTKKKRAPKVQKVHQLCLCTVYGFLISTTVLKSILARRLFV